MKTSLLALTMAMGLASALPQATQTSVVVSSDGLSNAFKARLAAKGPGKGQAHLVKPKDSAPAGSRSGRFLAEVQAAAGSSSASKASSSTASKSTLPTGTQSQAEQDYLDSIYGLDDSGDDDSSSDGEYYSGSDSSSDLDQCFTNAPCCPKQAKCTNKKFNGTCTADAEFPGLDVVSLAAQPGNNVTYTNELYGVYAQPIDIINCGIYTDTMKRLLSDNQAQAYLGLQDMKQNGTSSPWGYKSFFKTTSNIQLVNEMFTAVQNATHPYDVGCYGGAHVAAVCVNNNTGIPSSLRQACEGEGMISFSTLDYPSAIMICPAVFDYGTLTKLPPNMETDEQYVHCPTVSSGGNVTADDYTFENSTNVNLFNTLAWMYLSSSINSGYVDDVQTAISNDETESVEDGSNYALYANSIQKCYNTFPK